MIDLLAIALWMSTPIALAAIGETFAERSGMLNVGLEGMMLSGAFAGVAVTFFTGSPWLGFLAAACAGAAVGVLHAVLVLWGRLDQIVSGIAINLLALGTTGVLLAAFFTGERRARVPGMPQVRIPVLADIPLVGQALFQQRTATLLLPVIAVTISLVLFKTRWGLQVRAVGQDAAAAILEGVNVRAVRTWVNGWAGFLAGAGGGFLTLGITNRFSVGIISGRGFIALALVIVARWHPGLVLGIAWLFGFAEAFGIRAQAAGGAIPFQVFLAIPYLAAVLVLFTRISSREGPREVGKAWALDRL